MAMKGSVIDLVYIFTFLLIFSTCTIVAFMIMGEAGPQFAAMSPTSAEVITSANTAIAGFDGLFVFMTFGMIMASIILAYYVDSHPIMFVVSFIVYIFVVMVSSIFSNIYQSFVSTSGLSTYAGSFTMMQQIWFNLPTIATVSGAMIIIVAYSKWRSSGGYQP